jgi:hypothetical protein
VAEPVQGGGAKEPVGESLPQIEEIELLVWLDPLFQGSSRFAGPRKSQGIFRVAAGLTKVAGIIVTGPIRVWNWKRKPNREEPGELSQPRVGAPGVR